MVPGGDKGDKLCFALEGRCLSDVSWPPKILSICFYVCEEMFKANRVIISLVVGIMWKHSTSNIYQYIHSFKVMLYQ